jgi:hypothetical protein
VAVLFTLDEIFFELLGCYEKKNNTGFGCGWWLWKGEKDGFGYVTPARLGPEWDELPECG